MVTRVEVLHVRVATDRAFESVSAAFRAQLGAFDGPALAEALAAGEPDATRAAIRRMEGPSGFLLFAAHDHGALLALAGVGAKAVQYVVGNPLFAVEMTRHALGASLYAPLRVLISESGPGRTCIEYDRPSSLFGQFGMPEVDRVAAGLDRKLEALVEAALR